MLGPYSEPAETPQSPGGVWGGYLLWALSNSCMTPWSPPTPAVGRDDNGHTPGLGGSPVPGQGRALPGQVAGPRTQTATEVRRGRGTARGIRLAGSSKEGSGGRAVHPAEQPGLEPRRHEPSSSWPRPAGGASEGSARPAGEGGAGPHWEKTAWALAATHPLGPGGLLTSTAQGPRLALRPLLCQPGGGGTSESPLEGGGGGRPCWPSGPLRLPLRP